MSHQRKYGIDGSIGPAPGFTWAEVKDGYGRLPTSRTDRLRIVYQARYLNGLRAILAERHNVKKRNVLIYVTSWYRSPAYNRRIGGASRSQHIYSRATDIVIILRRSDGKIVRLSPRYVGNIARRINAFDNGGIGVYGAGHGSFTHLDHRPGAARWASPSRLAVAA